MLEKSLLPSKTFPAERVFEILSGKSIFHSQRILFKLLGLVV
ncbi:MAG: hypothetical protein QXJ00_02460 [Candidatus Nezhaarchaeales archaeon]